MVVGGYWAESVPRIVDAGGAQVQGVDRIHDEMHHVVLGDPVPEVGRQQLGGVVVDQNELGCHPWSLTARSGFVPLLSPTGC
jgi:hypothetical protein